ncbi:hypothetical protein D3C78_1598230 [compost metagenome]
MAYHVHLKNCLFHVHRFEIKSLRPYQFQFIIGISHNSSRFVFNEQRLQTTFLTELAVDLCLVLAYLTFELVHYCIYRCIHVVAAFFSTKHYSGQRNCNLNRVQASYDTQSDVTT